MNSHFKISSFNEAVLSLRNMSSALPPDDILFRVLTREIDVLPADSELSKYYQDCRSKIRLLPLLNMSGLKALDALLSDSSEVLSLSGKVAYTKDTIVNWANSLYPNEDEANKGARVSAHIENDFIPDQKNEGYYYSRGNLESGGTTYIVLPDSPVVKFNSTLLGLFEAERLNARRENKDFINLSWSHHNHPIGSGLASPTDKLFGHSWSKNDLVAIGTQSKPALLTSPRGLSLIIPGFVPRDPAKYRQQLEGKLTGFHIAEHLKSGTSLSEADRHKLGFAVSSFVVQGNPLRLDKLFSLEAFKHLQSNPIVQQIRMKYLSRSLTREHMSNMFNVPVFRELTTVNTGYTPIFLTWRQLDRLNLMNENIDQAILKIKDHWLRFYQQYF